MLKYVLVILAGLYGVSPVDIVPEFFLGWVGWIDDIIIFYLLWRFYFSTNRQPWQRKGKGGPSHGESKRERRTDGTSAGSADHDGLKDPHEVLGVPPNASEAEIKQAYRALAGQYHPDKVNHLGEEFRDLAEKRFKEIQAAYDALVRR